MEDHEMAGLSDVLQRNSARSYDRSWSMPGAFYTDPDLLALEKERLFLQEWVCLGRIEEAMNPGDYFTYQLCGEPIVVIRGDDGVVRAFSNVCRHRGTVIADGRGNGKRLVCPYHHWSYDNRGHLMGAPFLGTREDFDRSACRLPEFACVSWQGFLFVSLGSNPTNLLRELDGLETLIGPYHMDQMILRYQAEEVWETNWKCLLENFMEGYHLTPLHRETLHPVNPTKLCRHFAPGEAYFGYNAGFSPSLSRSQQGHPDLSADQAANCVMYAVPPGLVVGCASDYSSFLCLQPETVDRVRVKMGLIFFGADWPPEKVDWAVQLFQRTMAEDKAVLLRLMRGLRSRHYQPGPLAPADFEGSVCDFYTYLHKKLGSAMLARPGDHESTEQGAIAARVWCR